MTRVFHKSSRLQRLVFILGLAALLVLFMPADAQQSPPAMSNPIPLVTTRQIDVHSGPGAYYPLLITLPPKTALQITAIFEDGTWLVVSLPDGSTGWILFVPNALQLSLDDLETLPTVELPVATATPAFTASPTAIDTLAATFTPTNTVTPLPTLSPTLAPTITLAAQPFVRALRPTNIYAQPDASATLIGSLGVDSTANVLALSSDRQWLQIPLASGRLGWITADPTFVAQIGDFSALQVFDLPTAPSPTETLTILSTASPLPTLTLPPTETPSPTPTFETTPVSVKPTSTTSTTTQEIIAVVGGDNQSKALRFTPSTDAEIVMLVRRGTRVVIFAQKTIEQYLWYNVRLADGRVGWMRFDTLTVYGTPTPVVTIPPPSVSSTPTPRPFATGTLTPSVDWTAGTILVVSNPEGVWLRESPASDVVNATLAPSNTVTATGNFQFAFGQWWWEVRADWGALGWVEQSSLLRS